MQTPGPTQAVRSQRARHILARLGILTCLFGCAAVKPPLRVANDALEAACEGMAQSLAERSGADARRIAATTCAVESFTRTLRETLLSQQIEAARAAGVAVPSITSDHLEPEPAEYQDAE